ncbi:uncharacterized protein SPAPADRAFT_66906 [Spathaspora passalidarum NRRL Y-27907]|uniref:Uncharacterized protein n=1 Tax=Spathaspora passalidarum (strain NRRL Y-27907 / 11-Y1) TaxID=619300 RepID=G3APV5_SPAPN|nr:uncharacterized protein SPAPADRAFT_66906 [Spathaspora passalidarum NRRL Y-27907]EGW32276.1 hypothetical protein SPAPADRAFT_66906 [Spathaspora passalidarum NRRL Y-27907]
MWYWYFFLVSLVVGLEINGDSDKSWQPLREVLVQQTQDNGILRTFEAGDSEQVSSREFANEKELINSRFWKNLQKRKDKEMAKSTVILVKDTNTVYHFDESEWTDEVGADHEVETASSPREITLVEMKFGFLKPFEYTFPLTGCIRMKKGIPTMYQSYSHQLYLTLPPEISVRTTVILLSASATVGSYGLSLSYEKDSSLTCKASPGKRVQIFRKERYALFPKAKLRKVKFKTKFKSGIWKNVFTSLKHKNLGLMFLDLTKSEKPYCEARPDRLQCHQLGSKKGAFADI